jgi:hypothetical protein
MPVDNEILERVRTAASDASSWHGIRAALTAGDSGDQPDMRLRPFVFAFAYNLIDG